MDQHELARLEQRRTEGQMTQADAVRLLDEVVRLRRWLAYAAENATYPYAQMQLHDALADRAAVPPPS